jgi:mannose-6-phosphate isomerase-like protein (cupin superfamily)
MRRLRIRLGADAEIRPAADVISAQEPQSVRIESNPTTEAYVFKAGDQIENPVTGERIVFHETSAENGGKRVVFEAIVKPGGFVAAAHLHPNQTEHFEVLEGTLGMRRGKDELELGPGEDVVVEPGVPHKFRNAGDTDVRFRCTVTPALQFERLIATMYALAADGKTNKKGMPNPIRLAAIARYHFEDVRLPFPPVWMQRAGLALGAPTAKLFGFTPTYDPIPGELAPNV